MTSGTTVKPQVTLIENTYDELGRLMTSQKGGQAGLNTAYEYNIRSWISSIASSLFSEDLEYGYSGNISQMQWVTGGQTRKYDFTYDNLSRLKSAGYTGIGNEQYGTSYSYDKHGNMLTLQRCGKKGAGTNAVDYGLVDNLTAKYTGNQLKYISDAVDNFTLNSSMDFKEYTEGTNTEYSYNLNGAMYKDLNKGISQIQYNSLDLPRIVDIKNQSVEGRNEYTYSASGAKLKAVQKWNPDYNSAPVIGSGVNVSALTKSTTTDYAGNIIYENGKLKRILVDGGYYEDGNYYFYISDHLGNNRIVADAAASAVQSTQYYPFGMLFADGAGQDVQPYKYNGKELDTRNGLNTHDYLTRALGGDFPVFRTPDRHAENYYPMSPYAYAGNNPVNVIDPTGMDTTHVAHYPVQHYDNVVNLAAGNSGSYKVQHVSPGGENIIVVDNDLPEVVVTADGPLSGIENHGGVLRKNGQIMGEAPLVRVYPEAEILMAGRGIATAAGRRMVAVTVGNGGDNVASMNIIREIRKGEKISDIVAAAQMRTYSTGVEHAVVTLGENSIAPGTRVLVSGGKDGISFGAGEIKTLFGHTHPYPTGASLGDKQALQILNQSKQYIFEGFNPNPIILRK
ncbi:MAG: hypothetical protein LBV71_03900 [Prevotella sp.]|nr:hypothetical protein [Prevotella sp.]